MASEIHNKNTKHNRMMKIIFLFILWQLVFNVLFVLSQGISPGRKDTLSSNTRSGMDNMPNFLKEVKIMIANLRQRYLFTHLGDLIVHVFAIC